jgi:hypothetical protein
MYFYLKTVTSDSVMVKGGSKDAGHVDWMEVLSVDWVADGSNRRNEVRLTIPETSTDLMRHKARDARFPTVILDVPARREWYQFREAFISDLSFYGDSASMMSLSLQFKSVEARPGTYTPAAAAAAQAAKVAASVGLAKLRRVLTK